MAVTLEQFMAAIRAQESGGNYKEPPNRVGASGAYQFMPGTWANYKGYSAAYLAPPAVQDEKARLLMQSYYQQFGNWESVAKAWYAGPGFASKNQTVKQEGNAPSINQYATEVMGRLGQRVQTASVGAPGAVVVARPTDKAGILALQQQMKAAGFDPGPLDGIWGPKTQAAFDRYNTSQGTKPTAAPLAGQALEDKVTALALSQHGGILAPFVNDPEIRALIARQERGEIDDETFLGLLYQTNVWRSMTAAQRNWQTLETSDPAEAARRVQQKSVAVMAQSRTMGVTLSQERADALAKESLRAGWTDLQMEQAIGAEFQYNEAQLAGKAAEYRNVVDGALNAYGIRFDDSQKGLYVQWMMQGYVDEGWVENQIREYAKGKYPTLGDWFDSGKTLVQYTNPMELELANLLGINPGDVEWDDPKWGRFLDYADPAMSGQRRAMTIDEMLRTARSDPRYGYDDTERAVAEKRDIGMGILQKWGMVSG